MLTHQQQDHYFKRSMEGYSVAVIVLICKHKYLKKKNLECASGQKLQP